MASTKGFEPLTARLEGVCSIQLSYVDISLSTAQLEYHIFFEVARVFDAFFKINHFHQDF